MVGHLCDSVILSSIEMQLGFEGISVRVLKVGPSIYVLLFLKKKR